MKVIWIIFINIVSLLIVIGIFSMLYDPFEKQVMGGLLLIYVTIISYFSTLGRANLETHSAIFDYLISIKESVDGEEQLDDRDAVETIKSKLKSTEKEFYVNTIFHFIFYLIAIFNLIFPT